MRTYVLAGLAGAVGAVVGAALMLTLKVGANTSCIDLYQQQVSPLCAAPTAAPWAVAVGAFVGAALAATTAAMTARR